MYRITIAALLSTAVGCSTGQSATGGRTAREGSSTVAGIITLADGVGPKTGDFCEGLSVKVTPASAPEDVLGTRQVRTSRGRCSYQLDNLPGGSEQLLLTVTPSPAWRCENGATPTVTQATQTLQLREHQAETRDFRVTCEAAPAQATPATP